MQVMNKQLYLTSIMIIVVMAVLMMNARIYTKVRKMNQIYQMHQMNQISARSYKGFTCSPTQNYYYNLKFRKMMYVYMYVCMYVKMYLFNVCSLFLHLCMHVCMYLL